MQYLLYGTIGSSGHCKSNDVRSDQATFLRSDPLINNRSCDFKNKIFYYISRF